MSDTWLGKRVEMVRMFGDPPQPRPGWRGTVAKAERIRGGTDAEYLSLEVDWDLGQRLTVTIPPDVLVEVVVNDWVITVEELAGSLTTGNLLPPRGAFLAGFDPDAFDGRGDAVWTLNPAEALRFPNSGAALDFWGTQSTTHPLRADGLPNRPLTAFTVTIDRL